MENDNNYQSNPLHGVSLKNMLVELVEHYGFEILHAYLNINCFGTNASIASSLKFLKNTPWARESVEGFYLYKFKNLPRATAEQFLLPPRDRVIPDTQSVGAPAELSLADAERVREKREKKSAGLRPGQGKRPAPPRGKPAAKRDKQAAPNNDEDPWAKWRE